MELSGLLERLKMDHLDAQLDSVCEQAAERELDYKSFLAQALNTEWQGRYQRGIETRLRQARLPWVKTIEQFEFDFQPSVDRRQVRELCGLSFVERAHNVVILGPPGTGKTHLAVGLAVKAVDAGYSVQFVTLETLMTRLVKAKHENRLERALKQLGYPKLLIIDAINKNIQWVSDTGFKAKMIVVSNVDDDPQLEIILNTGRVIDSRFFNIEFESDGPYGDRITLFDINNDGYPDVFGEFADFSIRVYDIWAQRELW